MWAWPFPSGRRRPSLRLGLPWLVGFVAWLALARLAVDHRDLRDSGPYARVAWLALGAFVLPGLVAAVSRLLGVFFRPRAFVCTMGACFLATGATLLVLFPDFPAFAFVGGSTVAGVGAGTYALGTSLDLDAWRDANDR